jgi:hypothetical protein
MTTLDSKALLRGEAPVDKVKAYRGCGTPREQAVMEGATRAPVVVFWAFSKGQLIGKP